jgi:hypothetical protein
MKSRTDWGGLLITCAIAIVCANALVYAARQANPLIMSDEWAYLDGFVRKAAGSELTLSDFFAKRFALDHAQPLRRAVLYVHYRWFGLDYGIQALAGVLFAFANLVLFWKIAAPDDDGQRRQAWFRLAFLALAAVYLSLNAGTIYTWPLLTLGFSSHFFVLACLLSAWKANIDGTRRSAAILFAAALAMDVVADDTGLLVSIALVLATILWRWRRNAMRGAAMAPALWNMVLPVAVAYAAHRAFHFVATQGAVAAYPLADQFSAGNILHSLHERMPGLLVGLHVPLVAAIAQKSKLAWMLGSGATVAEWVVFAAMALAHAWFWRRAWSGPTGRAGYVAMVLMLYLYGALAGILVGRASLYGADYFWQPRYVFLYQWGVVALLLMAIDAVSRASADAARTGGVPRLATVACAIALLALQCCLATATWGGARYSSGFQRKLARQIGELAAHPERVPKKCAPALIVCRYPLEQRKELVRFLQENKLNVFSPDFQARYRLYPEKPR